ncbi:hypothetical protein LEP1GSC041_0234 [Leptospira noguchii str. 2006001870]|nr:hypothetical protein [Leptospira noguchii]EKR72408.1 hypothetical protein LEP1GSC041_0234 [Leptospira noguchii str. 2006001870]
MAVVTTTVFDLENLVGTLSTVAVVTTTVFDLENLVGTLLWP